jgi:hypothetical protein
METTANPMQKAHSAPRCHAKAKAKTTGNRCKSPAVRGWHVCRMHGAGGGAPTGPSNGAWQHGGRSAKAEQSQRYLMALVKLARDGLDEIGLMKQSG